MRAITARYKIPLLVSLVCALALIALGGITYWLSAILVFLGAIIGFIILDLEYIVHAYLVDPLSETSLLIKSYIRAKNAGEYARFLSENEYTLGEVSIRSVLFQVGLFLFTIYVVTTSANAFVQGAALSMYANLLYYQFVEFKKTQTLQRWFWIYTGNLNVGVYKIYIGLIFLSLVFVLAMI